MKKLILILFFLSLSTLNAIDISSKKGYFVNEEIHVNVSHLLANSKNWIAIFKKDAPSNSSNILRWKWIGYKRTANFSFQGLPLGNYQVRVFYNNTYTPKASFDFYVSDTPAIELKTKKPIYRTTEKIQIEVANMLGDEHDWIAIYPKGSSSNDWSNVVYWTWLHGERDKFIEFNPITEEGEYEVRAFFKNSYIVEASYSFKVIKVTTELKIPYHTYTEQNRIYISPKGFESNRGDWVGIYHKGVDNSWENVIAWVWIINKNHLSSFNPLPVGEYEARGFFKNSFKTEATVPFKVIDYSIDTNKLISKAKKQCLEENNNTEDVLCANDSESVYILTKRIFNQGFYFGHYKISLSDNSVKTIKETFLSSSERYHHMRKQIFFEEPNNTSIYIIRTFNSFADENGNYLFYSKNKDTLLLKKWWYEYKGHIVKGSTRVFDSNKKLYFEVISGREGDKFKYNEIYDISDENNVTLISKERMPVDD